jgi:DNA-directed RNA polymerase specialized sigma24 family protein
MSGIGPELLARLLDQRGPALELYARQWCDSPADVVQEALVQLVRQPAEPPNLLAWLYRTVRNGAISARRAADRRRRHERAAAASGARWFAADPAGGLDPQVAGEALASLPLDQREVIVAHLWGGLKFEEIADLAGTSASTAHRRYQAGVQTLRQKLGIACFPNDQRPTN